MKEIISKDLLSEVLTGNVKSFSIDKNNVYYDIDHGTSINIYELAHKCKEWAYNKGFDIYSDFNGADVCHIGSNYSVAPFHYNFTELEAIFKACQWILDNKDK